MKNASQPVLEAITMGNLIQQIKIVKECTQSLMLSDSVHRQDVLITLAELLRQSAEEILSANAKDLSSILKEDPRYDRLLLTEERIDAIADDVEQVAALPDPCGKLLDVRQLENGLVLNKVSVPLGVVAVIYESRPNVTIDVFALCFKAGNACILKGGKEAVHSNEALVSLIHEALNIHSVTENAVYLLPSDRQAAEVLLNATGYVDVCIPRGSQQLIHFVREHAKIPVIETGAGIVHTYFDSSGDTSKGCLIINNAKTRRVSVCNALDTLIIHRDRLDQLYELVVLLKESRVMLFADEQSFKVLKAFYPGSLLKLAEVSDYGTEFLDYKMSVKTVDSVIDAVAHIKKYSSGHSEAIIAEDVQVIDYFLNQVDAAVVYANASTAFTDGGQFGLGAEIGISTQKLHARGPMGLEALTSYKWLVYGDGQIRT